MSGEKTEDSRGGIDYWVIKLDSTDRKFGTKQLVEILMIGAAHLQLQMMAV
jgi:hypothetical protein